MKLDSIFSKIVLSSVVLLVISFFPNTTHAAYVLDNTFTTGTGFHSYVGSLALQDDGKIIVGGYFGEYDGDAVNYIARLNSDGTLDNTFTTGTGFDGSVDQIALQDDGKIIVGGNFNEYDGDAVNYIARLNSDGTLDNTFTTGTGFDGLVFSLALQDDGKIIVGGEYTTYDGNGANRIVRLNSDGTLDNTFTTGTGFDGGVRTLTLQDDGKIIVGGNFNVYDGDAIGQDIARLNPDGTLDNTFTTGTGFDGGVLTLTLQDDGKIIVGGNFTEYDGDAIGQDIARLNPDGTLDNTFTTGAGFDGSVDQIALQDDGKIIVGGYFGEYDGNTAHYIARLNPDGTLDNTFTTGTGFDGQITSLALQDDGKIIVGGTFNNYDGNTTNYIARLYVDTTAPTISTTNPADNATGIATNLFNVNGATVEFDENIVTGTGNITIHDASDDSVIATFDVANTDYVSISDNVIHLYTEEEEIALERETNYYILIDAGAFEDESGNSFVGISDQTTWSFVTQLQTTVILDDEFITGEGFTGYYPAVDSLVVQSDGKIIVGGGLLTYDGVSIGQGIARLNHDGSLDETFVTGDGFNGNVASLILQDDGKIIVGGAFTEYDGDTLNYIARLNSDGTLDNTFTTGAGFDSNVYSLALQDDGKIIVGGAFESYDGQVSNGIARLNPDGSLDETFEATGGGFRDGINYSWITSLAIQTDGKIIVGGRFDEYNGNPIGSDIARLNLDGSLDESFETGGEFDAAGGVWGLALQNNGHVIVGYYDGTDNNHQYITRLNPDGSLDESFITGNRLVTTTYGSSPSLVIQDDDKVIVWGSFYSYGAQSVGFGLIRLNPDGTLDETFVTGLGFSYDQGSYYNGVEAVVIQDDGQLIVGGEFESYDGEAAYKIARLIPPVDEEDVDESSSSSGSTSTRTRLLRKIDLLLALPPTSANTTLDSILRQFILILEKYLERLQAEQSARN